MNSYLDYTDYAPRNGSEPKDHSTFYLTIALVSLFAFTLMVYVLSSIISINTLQVQADYQYSQVVHAK